ncbi:MAG: hypothetical protein RIT27_963 [Pseudomonadota bacterium]|jgi:hypothetical protein
MRYLNLIILINLFVSSSYAAPPTIKCWTNESGVKECGSAIPPEYASQGHQELNTKGEIVKQVGHEKSPEERRALVEKEQQALEEQKHAKEQEAQDRKLLDLYPSESDIEAAKNGKLESIKASVDVTQKQLNFYISSLKEAEKTFSLPDLKDRTKLEAHIAGLKEQISKFEESINNKKKESEAAIKEYDDYLQRYREIKRRVMSEKMSPINKSNAINNPPK